MFEEKKVPKQQMFGSIDFSTTMHPAVRWKTHLTDCLLSSYSNKLTFHTEFGAPAVFVDENKKDEEKDAGEAGQAHSNGDLKDRKFTHKGD